MAKQCYYEVLGGARGDRGGEIKRAFRLLPEECHPDRHGGDTAAAESEFRAALHHRPDYALACVSLAAILHEREDAAGAEELCRRALAVDPRGVPALRLLGLILNARECHEEALQVPRRAVEIAPTDVPVERKVALLNPKKRGLNMTVFVNIKLSAHGRSNLDEPEQAVVAYPEVLECHTRAGESNYLRKAVDRDIDRH